MNEKITKTSNYRRTVCYHMREFFFSSVRIAKALKISHEEMVNRIEDVCKMNDISIRCVPDTYPQQKEMDMIYKVTPNDTGNYYLLNKNATCLIAAEIITGKKAILFFRLIERYCRHYEFIFFGHFYGSFAYIYYCHNPKTFKYKLIDHIDWYIKDNSIEDYLQAAKVVVVDFILVRYRVLQNAKRYSNIINQDLSYDEASEIANLINLAEDKDIMLTKPENLLFTYDDKNAVADAWIDNEELSQILKSNFNPDLPNIDLLIRSYLSQLKNPNVLSTIYLHYEHFSKKIKLLIKYIFHQINEQELITAISLKYNLDQDDSKLFINNVNAHIDLIFADFYKYYSTNKL